MEAWAELSAELDAEGVEVDEDSGAGVDALIAFMIGFFLFFSPGRQAVDDEARAFSSIAFLNCPPAFSHPVAQNAFGEPSRTPCVCLARLFVKKIPQDEMLPGHHDLRQSPRDDREDVQLGFSNNHKQVSGREECLMVPFVGSDFE